MLLAYEATRDLAVVDIDVQTPVAATEARPGPPSLIGNLGEGVRGGGVIAGHALDRVPADETGPIAADGDAGDVHPHNGLVDRRQPGAAQLDGPERPRDGQKERAGHRLGSATCV